MGSGNIFTKYFSRSNGKGKENKASSSGQASNQLSRNPLLERRHLSLGSLIQPRDTGNGASQSGQMEDGNNTRQRSPQEKSIPEATQSSQSAPNEREDCCDCCYVPVAPGDVLKCPCEHGYCRDCLITMLGLALQSEARFPLRCCRVEVPLDSENLGLPESLIRDYRRKKAEYTAKNRVYCHWQQCSSYIASEYIQEFEATCQACSRKTCTLCRRAIHQGECRDGEDEDKQQLMSLAEAKG